MGILSHLLTGAARGGTAYLEGDQRREELEREKRQRLLEEALLNLRMEEGQERLRQMRKPPNVPKPKPPTVTRSGLDASGVPTRVSGDPDQVSEFDLRPEPEPTPNATAAPSLTPGQRLTERAREEGRVKEEALGNALTWAGSGNIPREQGIQLIAKQHKLPVGTASTIWDSAVQRLTMQEGRELMNEGREAEVPAGSSEPFLPPAVISEIDRELAGGKTRQQILDEMRAEDVPARDLIAANMYILGKGGGD